MFVDWMENFPLEGKKENNEVGKMCRYCDSNILDALAINSKDEAVIINQDTETGEYFIDGLDERVYIDYCPMCRKEAGRVKRHASGYWYQFIIPRRLTLPPTRIYRWLNFYWRLKDKEGKQ